MYGYIYLITNLINNKKYIGKHKSEYFDESYHGSGKLITKAIEKYGWENFSYELIDTAENLGELNDKEKYYIAQVKADSSNEYYNISAGGDGGDTISNLPLYKKLQVLEKFKNRPKPMGKLNGMFGKQHTDGWKKQHSESISGEKHPFFGTPRDSDTIEKIKLTRAEKIKCSNGEEVHWFKEDEIPEGYIPHTSLPQTEEQKLHNSQARKKQKKYTNGLIDIFCTPGEEPENFYLGSVNSATVLNYTWVSNGIDEHYIKPGETIPKGYHKGRLPKSKEEKAKHNSCGGKVKCTNGIINKYFYLNQIPEGFYRMKTERSETAALADLLNDD